MALGISFIPPNQQQQQQQTSQQAPLQQALQMLSLRVPRFGGTNPILPPQLQQRQPGQPLPPVPGTPEWEELMRRLAAGGVPPTNQGQPPPSTPPPVFQYPAPNPRPGSEVMWRSETPGFTSPFIGTPGGRPPGGTIIPDPKQY